MQPRWIAAAWLLVGLWCVNLGWANLGRAAEPTAEPAEEDRQPATLETVIADAAIEGDAVGNGDFADPRIRYRLTNLTWNLGYTYQDEHAEAWLACLRDEKKDWLARCCAAYFLLEKQAEARTFLERQLESGNRERRYNAAVVLVWFYYDHGPDPWAVDRMSRLIAAGTIDRGGGVDRDDSGDPFSEHINSPHGKLCRALASSKSRDAAAALIAALRRNPDADGAARALGEMEATQAAPLLLKMLEARTGETYDVVFALGRLKCAEAVPTLTARLGKPGPSHDVPNTEVDPRLDRCILAALGDIGDPTAAPAVKAYLDTAPNGHCLHDAQRTLARLTQPDPVAALIALYRSTANRYEKENTLDVLSQYPDDRVVDFCLSLAQSSDSAYLRRSAIWCLRDLGNRRALSALAALLDHPFPAQLKIDFCKVNPTDVPLYFQTLLVSSLRKASHQNLGADRSRWDAWIKTHIPNDASSSPPNPQ